MSKFIKLVFFGISVFFISGIQAQESDPWTQYMMPGDMHKKLEKYSGNFEMEITMNMMDGIDPVIMKVYSLHKMILDGRFLEMTQTGDMMGMPYHSITTLGYNNSDKNYQLSTITNMGTGTLFVSGTHDQSGRTATLTGTLSNPVNGQIIQIKQVIHFIDDDNLLIENFDQEQDKTEKKTITYRFSRIK